MTVMLNGLERTPFNEAVRVVVPNPAPVNAPVPAPTVTIPLVPALQLTCAVILAVVLSE